MRKEGIALKKCLATLSLALILLSVQTNPDCAYAQQHQQEPSYAKWGRLAMEQVAKRYHVEILDYDHIGRQTISPKITQETFKLWVRDQTNQEYGVFVYIQFDTQSEKLRSIRFKETQH